MPQRHLHVPDPVRKLLSAQSRMLDNWAEYDDEAKGELWLALHNAADAVREYYQIANSGSQSALLKCHRCRAKPGEACSCDQ